MAWQGVVTVCLGVVLVASPEPLAATRGVTVSGRGTETLLALVVAGQEDLEQDGDQEEEAVMDVRDVMLTVIKWGGAVNLHSDDGNGEHNLLQLAGHAVAQLRGALGVGFAFADRSVDCAGARVSAAAGQHGDGDHCAREENIEDNAQEREEGDAT